MSDWRKKNSLQIFNPVKTKKKTCNVQNTLPFWEYPMKSLHDMTSVSINTWCDGTEKTVVKVFVVREQEVCLCDGVGNYMSILSGKRK